MIPLPGFVYFDRNYQFSDGPTGKKLFVVLCDSPRDKDNVLVARTTSNPKSELTYGCHFPDKYETVFFLPVADSLFNEDTWIKFDYLNEYESSILERWTEIGALELEQTKNMLGCGSESYTMAAWQREAIRACGDSITL